MVRVQEVSDDVDAWSSASSDAGDSDVDSVLSDSDLQLDHYDPSKESYAERIAALKDMVSPTTRQSLADAASSTAGWVKWSLVKAGNVAWIATTSALLVGLPLLLSIEGEAALVQQEKEYMAQPGAQNPYGAPPPAGTLPGQAPAAGGAAAPQGLVPAGF
ncbi:hypothetical protein BMF94_1475 [Rhodotorula taiwanensis]|uniref:Uncharacterized protein n=1 Tax=Rhodotorula taiwanensis TaxID=741276 RepID=A0A2S5BF61_9BASI|nr:hypothetical protein BMF94_1475 [Rhodotorula taiwanensis]